MLVSSSVFAAPELAGGHATTGPGQQVTIPVDLLADGSVVALQFDLTFDDTVLSPQAVISGTALVGHDFDWQQLQPGSIRIVITTNSLEPLVSGILAELSFLAAAAAQEGTYPVVISNVVMADGSAQPVSATSILDGSVTLLVVDAIPVPTLGLMAMLLLIVLFAGIIWLFHQRGIGGVAFSLFLGLTLFSSTIVRAAPAPGDANNDGVVDTSDIPIIVAQILERSIAPGDPDCNADQVVDVLDTICAATQPPANTAPTLSAIADLTLGVDTALTLTAQASDPDVGDILTFSLDIAPAGMSIDPQSGVFSWMPDNTQVGDHPVSVKVEDPDMASDSKNFVITVEDTPNAAPVLDPITNQAILVDQLFSLTATATDPDVGALLSFSLSLAPTGMSIDAGTGTINWTPNNTQLGSHAVTVVVVDELNASDSTGFTVTVTQPVVQNLAPDMIPPGNRVLQADDPFVTPIFATDPNPGDVLTFSLTNAPAGVSIDPQSGMLSWTPGSGDLGVNDITALVTDPGGLTDAEMFSIEVVQSRVEPTANAAPALVVPADQNLVFDTLLSLQASATDADAGDTLVFEFINAPSGMSINSVSGAINWTPTEPQLGAHDVAVRVTDTAGAVAVGSFIVMVVDVNKAPVAVEEVYLARIGETLTIPPPGVLANDSDPNNDPLTSVLVSTTTQGALDLRSDGSFDYTPDDSVTIGPVELEVQCDISIADGGVYQANGTLAVGDVDNDGELEIVGLSFSAYNNVTGIFWIINAADCSKESDQSTEINIINAGGMADSSHPGLLDIDGDGDLEIIALRSNDPTSGLPDTKHLLALHHDGTLAWPGNGGSATSAYVLNEDLGGDKPGPTFADLDADGKVEILMVRTMAGVTHGSQRQVLTVYNSVDGSIKWEHVGEEFYRDGRHRPPVIVDLDLDGTLEVISNTSVVDHLGNLEYLLPADLFGGFPQYLTTAVANFDADPYPEIVARDTGQNYLFKHDGSVVWKTAHPSTSWARNQIAVADFDGDGEVEFAYVQTTASFTGVITVFDNDGSVLWSHEGKPEYTLNSLHMNRSDNITAFDANADGVVDLVIQYSPVDNTNYGIYFFDGRDGSLLHYESFDWNSTSQRFTTIADVDGDGEAELISSYTGGIEGSTRVWQGTVANPLPPAPPLRNQWIFNQAMVADDASIITKPTPHWLQPGMNGWNMIKQPPHPLAGTTDSFIYKANDGEFDSNQATVTFDVQPAGNPPIFLSSPDTLTTTGFQYEYAPRVIDTDAGDSVSFILTASPPGMTIDPATGVVRWLPPTTGSFQVFILASDTIGFSTPQSYTLVVGDPVVVPDLIGQAEATATTTLTTANLMVGQTQTAHHPSIPAGAVSSQIPIAGAVAEFGSEVDLILSLGPAPEDIDDDTDGFTENQGDCNDNDNTIFPGASDIPGDGIDQDCDGIDGSQPISEIVIEPASLTLLEGESAVFSAFALFDDGRAQPIGAVASWGSSDDGVAAVNGNSGINAVAGGVATITATSNTISGNASVTVVSRDNNDVEPPLAIITTPGEGNVITAVVDIIGTASDAGLVRYRLDMAAAGEIQYTMIAERTVSVSNGILGQLDATQWPNGLYTLRLSVLDAGGNQSTDEMNVLIDGFLKVGQFSMSFTDFSLPASGLPLELIRTYDSRQRQKGDFGVGWTLSFKGATLDCLNPLGEDWAVLKGGLAYQLVPNRSHACVVQIPGQRAELFDFVPSATVSPIVPFSLLSGSFQARPGTRGKLTNPVGNNLIIVGAQPGPVQLLNDSDISLFAPELLRYTRPDGLALEFLDGELVLITDAAGNSITLNDNGLTHSSGRGFAFDRDASGRITQITNPKGDIQKYQYSAAGDLVSHIDALGNITRLFYNQHHGLLRIEDPLNRPVLRNDYDDAGRLISTTEPDGRVITFDYSLGGQQQTITDADGSITVVNSDEEGNVTRILDALGGQVLQAFDSQGNLLSRTDKNGHATTYTYDGQGNKLTETNALGDTRSFTYNTMGKVTFETDELGRSTSFTYNSKGLATARVNALGETDATLAWDARGNLIGRTDALGHSETFTYNAFGDLTSSTDGLGNQAIFSYDANGVLISKTGKLGETVSYTHNANSDLLTETDALGRTTQYEYDAAGQLIREIDPSGATVQKQYDDEGNLTAIVDPLGQSTLFVFNPQDQLTRSVSPGGLESEFQYDTLGRRTRVDTPGGQDVTVGYDMVGNIASQTDTLGNAFQASFDDINRPTEMTGPDGTTVQRVYDTAGNLLKLKDALGRSTTFEYDALNRLTRTVYVDGSEELQSWSAANEVVETTDTAGNVTHYQYDANGNLLSIIDSLGGQTSYEYDANDQRVAIEDGRGHRTTLVYDAAGQMIRRIYPGGTTESFQYNAAGRVASSTDPDGDVTQFEYDAKGRIVLKTYADASVETFSWNADDHLIEAMNAVGTVEYQYDSEALLSLVLHTDGSSVGYTYTANGLIDSITTRTAPAAPARTTLYAYDGFGRLTQVEDPDGGVSDYIYDPVSNLVSMNYPNGTTSTYQYDARNRLTQVAHSKGGEVLEQFDYVLDALGNRTQVSMSDGSTIEYDFDALSRLTRESHFDAAAVKQSEINYEYDAVGNRTRTVDMGGVETLYVYNEADQLLTRGATTHTWRADGNLSSRSDNTGTALYEFDARNRLIEVQQSLDVVNYSYDARGERASRSVNGQETHYLVGVAPPNLPSQVLVEYDGAGTEKAENVFGNRLVSRQQSGTKSYAHIDASLNVRLLSDTAGTVTDTYDYDAFGNLLSDSGATDNPYLFAGERRGLTEGLTYLRARYYDPQAGRFISRDPFEGLPERPFSLHRYQYGDQNPLGNVDPTGEISLVSVTVAITVIGLVAGIGVNYLTDIKSSAKEFKGLTNKFRAKFCRGALLGEGAAIASQDVLIAETESVPRPEGPTSANYDVFAFGWGWGVGTVGSNRGGEERFKAPGTRNITQFEGTGKLASGGYSVGLGGLGGGGVAAEAHFLPEGSQIPIYSVGLAGSALGTAGAAAVSLTTFWTLQGKNNSLFEGELDCYR